jgi:hypothetical protein
LLLRKKSGKWRLLIDLRNGSESMITMGALQPGLPTPACIPKEWPLIVLDLQDCFDTISIHPKDRKMFAFSVPSLNQQEPLQRYQLVAGAQMAWEDADQVSFTVPWYSHRQA